MQTEQQIQTHILAYLKAVPNCWVVKIIQANKNGVADILCCLNGRFIALEVKTPTGKTSLIQDYQLAQITAAGGVCAVVRSLDDVKNVIDGCQTQSSPAF